MKEIGIGQMYNNCRPGTAKDKLKDPLYELD